MDTIALSQRLIRTPSPVRDGNEVAVANAIQDALVEAGLPRASVIAREPERPNLILTLDFGSGGRHLVLSGHIDTKPVGEARWTHDPYEADIDGDRLYGLGSADMKAAVASMIVAAKRLSTVDVPTAGKLSLILTADEEMGSEFGARHLVQGLDLDADGLIIGEPSGIHADYDSLHLVSRGVGRFVVTAHAKQGHSSLSNLLGFRNAGVDLAGAITALAQDPQLDAPPNLDSLRDWESTLNPAMRYGGGYGYGVLPEWMSARVELRALPNLVPDDVLAQLRDKMDRYSAASGASISVEFDDYPLHWIKGSIVLGSDPLVDAVQRASEAAFGAKLPTSVFPGMTDSSWFSEAFPALPCLPALGPGLLRYAHGADEWVSIKAVHQTVDLYEALAREFCAPLP